MIIFIEKIFITALFLSFWSFSKIALAEVDHANYKHFVFEICNSEIEIANRLNIPLKVETERYHNRLKALIQNIVKEQKFKAKVVSNCGMSSNSSPVIRVRHGMYEYPNASLFQIVVGGLGHSEIDGLDAKFSVEGVQYQSKIPMMNKSYVDMVFLDPIGLAVEGSEDTTLGSGPEYSGALEVLKAKLVLAGAIYSGKSAWDLALQKIDEIYAYYEDLKRRNPNSLENIRVSEDIALITARYTILKDRGEKTNIEQIKRLNEEFKFTAIFYYFLIYEELEAGIDKSRLADNLRAIDWVFSNTSSEFENLLYEIAGIDRE